MNPNWNNKQALAVILKKWVCCSLNTYYKNKTKITFNIHQVFPGTSCDSKLNFSPDNSHNFSMKFFESGFSSRIAPGFFRILRNIYARICSGNFLQDYCRDSPRDILNLIQRFFQGFLPEFPETSQKKHPEMFSQILSDWFLKFTNFSLFFPKTSKKCFWNYHKNFAGNHSEILQEFLPL